MNLAADQLYPECEEPADIEFGEYVSEGPDPDEGPDEGEMEEPFNPAEINIISKQDSLGNLITRLEYGEIDMNTDFQRHADLWDTVKMSRLIESILIRLPLPAFYFDASDDAKWLVVDGLQRLSAIHKFVLEKDARKRLKLRGLEYLDETQIGTTFDKLSRTYKRRIGECSVTLYLVQKGTPEPVKYSIFRRINTGGIVLNDQEIRNAMTTPVIRQWIDGLARDENFIGIFGDRSKRMVDHELVLRFLAFHYQEYEKSTKNITTFIDEMMEQLKTAGEKKLSGFGETFRRAIRSCRLIFGDSAFEKIDKSRPGKRRRKSSPLYEAWMNALADIDEETMNVIVGKREVLIEKHCRLLSESADYFNSITYSTQKREHYRIRNETVKKLIEEVVSA